MTSLLRKLSNSKHKGTALIWLVVCISIFVSSLISKIHIEHKKISDFSVRYFEDVNYARVNIHKGMNYLIFGITHDSNQAKNQAEALFLESLLLFDQSFTKLKYTEIYQIDEENIASDIESFNYELNQFKKFIEETDLSKLKSEEYFNKVRIFSQNIGNKLDVVNSRVSKAVHDISNEHDYEFITVLWISSVLLLVVCINLFVINKAREESDKSLKMNRNMMAAIIDNSSSLIFLFDSNGKCMLANNSASSVFGLSSEEIIGKTRHEIMPEELASIHDQNDKIVIDSLKQFSFEENAIENDKVRTYLTVKFPLIDDKNRVYAVGGISTDITLRKQSEDKIKKSLEEKEVLLRELYHRSKNNMQVIHSMLRLQSSQTDNEEVKNVLLEAGNKIMSMALVHQKLYQAKNLSFLSLSEYLTELSGLISKSYIIQNKKIRFYSQIDEIRISIDAAIPLGLVISELLSNSFKYAFPGDREGSIQISAILDEESIVKLVYADDGIGVAEGFDFRNQSTLGLKIIFSIVENQLQGKINFINEGGIRCEIVFNNKLYLKTRI